MFSPDDIDKVPYFGIWAEGQPVQRLTRAALAVLREAAERCIDQDIQHPKPQTAPSGFFCFAGESSKFSFQNQAGSGAALVDWLRANFYDPTVP